MTAYTIRRLILIVPTLIIVSIIVFFTFRLIPGSVMDLMIAQQVTGSGALISREDLAHMLGIDMPIYIQYWEWFTNVLRGDLGYSLWKGYSVSEEILHRLPVSFELGVLSFLLSMTIALPIGIYSAVRQDTPIDYLGRSFAIANMAIPSFWLATMVIIYPSIWWNWSPPPRYVAFIENPIENLQIMVIPALIMGTHMAGMTMRMTRTMMLEVLRQDYIRTAWAKGLNERTIIIKHALKNALIPVVTIVGLQLPHTLGGSVIMEQIFSLPGLGRLTIEVLNSRDYAVLSGINLFMATLILVVNLLVDLTYAYLDPRVQYS